MKQWWGPKKSQMGVFASETLPILFHIAPERFFQRLADQGNTFLRECWESAGENVEAARRAAPLGLAYQILKPAPDTSIILITFPVPRGEPEAYFAALVLRPPKRKPLLGPPKSTRVFILEHSPGEDEPPTRLVEFTPRLEKIRLDITSDPQLDAFYAVICQILGV